MRSPTNTKTNMTQSRSDTDIIRLCEDELTPQSSSPHITQRAKRPRSTSDESPSKYDLDLRNELKEMISEFMSAQNARLLTLEAHIMDLKKQTTKIESSNSDLKSALNNLSDQMFSLESKITGLEKERAEISVQLLNLDQKVDSLERSLIKTCVEIRNVPLRPRESKLDLYTTVSQLTKLLGINITSEIRDISRYRIDKKKNSSALSIEFANTLAKSKFLDSVKNYNKDNPTEKLNSGSLGFQLKDKMPIFIDEQLTPQARKLFYLARNYAKTQKYEYCWISNGRILMKKTKESSYLVIRNEGQLEKLSKEPEA